MAKEKNLPVSRTGIDQVFDDFFGIGQGMESFNPPLDVEETDSGYVAALDLPGVKNEEVKIEARDGVLYISGERNKERREDRKGHHYSERSYGYFQRALSLPVGCDAEKISADFNDGILKIEIPKGETEKAKAIPIGIGTGKGAKAA